ncbi:hypothetical protein PHABIO_421 [Pseudomonas phage Phabio]|uniref:Uncharacterized protein n=1 Tax=Pseudomonas phage Phabio TaxID=2006668 RepID=A0A1Y0SU74_9CAUD|nr:hypothetical protein MZD05_gp421 [Pseudomonas phage Phabio]ARV77052.1 hypothetical protein PHABIO_421 [Pseudomonas phage Phabio]
MTQKSDRFTIHARWGNLPDRKKQDALNKIIEATIKKIKTDFPNAGFSEHYTDRRDNFTTSKLDVVFDQRVWVHPNSGRYDYNSFVGAVRAFDTLLKELPSECGVHGTYSTTDTKTPWVQRAESRSLGLVVRRGVSVVELDQKVLKRINLKFLGMDNYVQSLKLVGEPTEVAKVYASLRVHSRERKTDFYGMLNKVMYNHRNTRWAIVLKNDNDRTFTYGHSVTTRVDITLDTIFGYERPLELLVQQYVNTTPFGSDLYVLSV